MGGLCSKSVKGDKVFAKSDGHSDNHKSDGKNHKSTNMPSDLTSAGDHGLDKKKQEAAIAAGNGSDDFYDGIPWFNDSFPHKSRSVKSRHAVAKVGYFLASLIPCSISPICFFFVTFSFCFLLNLSTDQSVTYVYQKPGILMKHVAVVCGLC